MSMEGDPLGGAFTPQMLTAMKDIVEDALHPILSAMERGHGGPSDSPVGEVVNFKLSRQWAFLTQPLVRW